jgi:aromatic-L-amino-acid/L-tryptophan decarboxylase
VTPYAVNEFLPAALPGEALWTTSQRMSGALLPSAEEIHRLVETAMRYIAPLQARPDDLPLAGSGTDWLHRGDGHADMGAARRLAESVAEPAPERGGADLERLLAELFGRLAPASMNTLAGGYLGFIPSGGLFHAALADLIALSLNRYVTMSMAAPGFAAIEAQAVRWLCDIVGYPGSAGGVLTSGGSTAVLTAVHAARTAMLGSLGPAALEKAIVYASEHVHYSLEKALVICGVPRQNLRRIPVDDELRLRADALAEAIERDRSAGLRPFLVNATAGTTAVGAVDDLAALGRVAREHGLWFHVDAAYGGFFLLTRRGAAKMRGIEQADSVVLDPHKSLFLPYGTGALVVRDRERLRDAFDFSGAYLPSHREATPLLDEVMYLSTEQTRELRGLRLWLPIKMLGLAPFREQLDQKLDLAVCAAEALAQIPGVKIVAWPDLSILAFKLAPAGVRLAPGELDQLNHAFLDAIHRRGNILLSPFRGRSEGDFSIRMAILSFRTTPAHVERGLADIAEAAEEVLCAARLEPRRTHPTAEPMHHEGPTP